MLQVTPVAGRYRWLVRYPMPSATLQADPGVTLERNLRALAARSPRAAREVAAATPHPGLVLAETPQDAPSGELDGVALASRRRPLDEARRIADHIDLEATGGVVVLGFGLGHHVRAIAERAAGHAVVIVFEPDVALLRAVLERVDVASWIAEGRIVVVTSADDPAELAAAIAGAEGHLAGGVRIVEHPPSRERLRDLAGPFCDRLRRTIGTMRTQVVTTMLLTETTLRNVLMNADHYIRWPGIGELSGAARGWPAVVVSAGPSLRRNLHLLADPDRRRGVVVIAVQTVLRTLLRRGIRPDFVTALDHHEISKRFYEGLAPEQVADVTLVAEARANPAIPGSYPGPIRMPAERLLDDLLADVPELAHLRGERGSVPHGATVAHLAYDLARHLGCDPVVFIGQDLGFTDGQYYADGAAIHDVWASELNGFRTLETLEWQRIVRARDRLHRAEDHLGRPIYTDEQMATYLAHFERRFDEDAGRGLRVIDATEGGVRKRGAATMPLADALAEHAAPDPPPLPTPPRARGIDLLGPAAERFAEIRRDVRRVARCSRETARLLDQVAASQDDRPRADRLIRRIHRLRDEVEALGTPYRLVHRMNQTGTFKRFRMDRARELDDDQLTPIERQRRQIERDGMNVRWLGDAADTLEELLDAAASALRGGPRRTRDVLPSDDEQTPTPKRVTSRRTTVDALLVVRAADAERVRAPFLGTPLLRRTVERLAACTRLRDVVVATDARDAIGDLLAGTRGVRIEELGASDPPAWRGRIRRARIVARDCWRGGLGEATCFDEALDVEAAHAHCERSGAAGVVVLGPAWCLVDPGLCDTLIDRHLERPDRHGITFTQAAPGLAPCVLGRATIAELRAARAAGAPFATIGGLLGYLPQRPVADPIAQLSCVQIDTALRDVPFRCIPDGDAADPLAGALGRAGLDPATADGAAIARAVTNDAGDPPPGPTRVVLEVGRPVAAPASPRGRWWDAPAPRDPMPVELAASIARQAAELRGDVVVELAGRGGACCMGDAIDHPRLRELLPALRAALADRGALHVRTDLAADGAAGGLACLADADIVSVDLLAWRPEVYAALTGRDELPRVVERCQALLQRWEMADGGGPLDRWLVARATRCDAVHDDVETFYDHWTMATGAAVLDPLPRAQSGERIAPLTLPDLAARRAARTTMLVLADGGVPADPLDVTGASAVADLRLVPLALAWRALLATRGATRIQGD